MVNFTKKITEPGWFTERVIRKHLDEVVPYLKGRLLDAGCGHQPYRHILKCDTYVGMDFNDKFKPDVIGDIRDMKLFGSNEFDSILCSQVLEHVDDIDKTFKELYRVLKSGGCLCITAPFIARLHGAPYDYWRFSEFGLEFLFTKYGFEKILIKPMGGFLTTQCYLWNYFIFEKGSKYKIIHLFKKLLLVITNPLFLFVFKMDKDKSTPHNYIAIAKKQDKLLVVED